MVYLKISALQIVAIAAAIAALVAMVFPDNNPLRVVCGVPLVLLLPGYALVMALFPTATPGGVERFVLALGLSLTITILSGLLLSALPGGLQTGSWALLLSGVTLTAAIIALRRQPRTDLRYLWWLPAITGRQAGFVGAAILVTTVAVVVSTNGQAHQRFGDYSQLWMLPGSGQSQSTVRLGIGNDESSTRAYRLVLQVEGRTLQQWPLLRLAPKATWTALAVLPRTYHTAVEVKALLFRLDAPETVYRHTSVWVGV